MIPSGKFHLLTAAKKLLKTNQPMKKSIMKPEIAKENSENYENRIPMRLWAEDDLPSQKLLLKGTGTLSDAELLSIIIGSGVSGENSLDIAKKCCQTAEIAFRVLEVRSLRPSEDKRHR